MLPLLILAGAGIALKAYADYKAGQAAEDRARENARRAEMTADLALQRGEQKAGLVELASARRQGAQVTEFAHAGVDPTSGSAAKAVSTTAMIGALDATMVRNNAFREAWGYRLQGADFTQEAQRVDDAATFNLFADVFGGAAKIYSMGGKFS